MSLDMKNLRKSLRQQRRSVSPFQQKQTEKKVCSKLMRSTAFKHAKKIGLYLHAFGEVHTDLIIQHCFSLDKQVYLPMICHMNQKLVWINITRPQYLNRRFSHHTLGMQQPIATRGWCVEYLDLLLMPLLACDANGTRLGMGGGFYDKTLANSPVKPIRVGLAHDFQYLLAPLKRQAWDQGIDQLITPAKHFSFKRNLLKNLP